MQVSEGIELIRFSDLGEGNLQVQVAVRGVLAPSIDDHRSNKERFRSDAEYFSYIGRQSELLIHLFGDARNPLSPETSRGKQEEGF